VDATVEQMRGAAPARRKPVVPDAVLGMLILVVAEAMMFAGLLSAFTIARAGAAVWPPIGQPRLPFEATAVNTAALIASGVLMAVAAGRHRRDANDGRTTMNLAIALGAAFVLLQGTEWVGMLREGLTLTSSQLGSFFYLTIGLHGLHVVAGLVALVVARLSIVGGRRAAGRVAGAEVFWYFVVGVWPAVYLVVYR
jgi:cytochrome c oxidase subunit 3